MHAVFTTGILVATVTFALAARPSAAGQIDTDEIRTSPVEHRFIHGILGDAEFQLRLPTNWNGRLVVTSRGATGDEFAADGALMPTLLRKGYAYAASDEGWFRPTIASQPEDKFFESRARLVQLTGHAQSEVQHHYGQRAVRIFVVGTSNGGHHVRWLLEDFPGLYDGGISFAGFNSWFEWIRGQAVFIRNFDIIRPRMNDILAMVQSQPAWDHTTMPLFPPLTPDQISALTNIYNMPASLANGFEYDQGRLRGSESNWASTAVSGLTALRDILPEVDREYDPNGDGVLSDDELKAWDPASRPMNVEVGARKLDLTGQIRRPVIVVHGIADAFVGPKESLAYKNLVSYAIGQEAEKFVRVYLVPNLGHGTSVPFLGPGMDALEQWVDTAVGPGVINDLPPR
jgi:pimeloyl-ACP methyl ester carboxylesterase